MSRTAREVFHNPDHYKGTLAHYDEHGLQKPGLSSDIKDRNGNTVGRWRVKP